MTVVEVNLRCFCVRLSILFLVGWFLDLKTVGKIVASHSACAASDQGQNRVLCPEYFGFKCCRNFASLTGGRNQCDRAVWTGLKIMVKLHVNACEVRKQVTVC